MSLAPGTRLGPYQIVSQIGAGGMGEVYRAADTRLGRTVAIKVLPEHLASDQERLGRFRREAQAISGLNHPHICALHDVGDEHGAPFLVMEYVEGETLDDRIAKGPLRVDDALECATQIADALRAAHEHGIVHRDLKPGNVMITAAGVKLLDFGLAKLDTEATQLPAQTVARPLTEVGTILGTFRYMAPEQLQGEDADARTDLYALCLVLYEMLTGTPAFDVATKASLIAAIIKDRPRPLTDFQPAAPPQLDRVIQTGLAKDPSKRWQSARELTHALEWIRSESRHAATPATAPVSWWSKGLVAALVVALLAVVLLQRPPPVEPERRLEIWTGATSDPTGFAVSPDGRRLAYVAYGSAGTQLWLRSLDADRAEPLAQTLGASQPFWSPDSESIGFFAEGQLKRVDLVSRATTSLAEAISPYGGTWGTGGILYAPNPSSPALRIRASGGESTPVVSQPRIQLFPVFVGSGPTFFFEPFGPSPSEVRLARLGSPDSQPLLRDALGAEWHRSGYVLFVRKGALLAQRFDMAEGKVLGNEVLVADGVLTSNFGTGVALSVSSSGLVAYRRGLTTRELAWFDRSGRRLGQAGGPTNELRWPVISAKGRVVLQKTAGAQLWLIDSDGSTPTQFTFSPGGKLTPIWSPDEQWIAFSSLVRGGDVLRKRSNGTGEEETLFSFATRRGLSDWSPDGESILAGQAGDIEVLSLDGKPESRPYLADPAYSESRGVFSPNGRWVAYQSNESGRYEIYVRPFPDPTDGQSKVSTDGGSFARWSADGSELYYLSPAGVLMAVPVNSAAEVFSHGAAEELFRTRIAATEMAELVHPYDVAADGRFLMRVPGEEEVGPITVLLNWSPENE